MEELLEMYQTMGISPAVYAYGEKTIEHLKERFAAIDQVAEHNQAKVLRAMQKNKVSAACFVGMS
jgi:cystathionine beta-lyase family protein involved in aluminum resistance